MSGEIAQRFKLLVVDDIVENRVLLCRYLGTRGFDVSEADGGAAALTLLAQRRFDAVLLDIVMPEMDGIEVLKKIRANYPSHSLPVIMVSGKASNLDFKLALKLGANDYITKPIDLAGALTRIRGHLAGTPTKH